ncbi:hypothetical protein [Thermococcus atlanticus]
MKVLKREIHSITQRVNLKHLAVLWAVTVLSNILFALYLLEDYSEAIFSALKFSFAYFLLLVIYNPHSIKACIQNCILGYVPSHQDIRNIINAIEWATNPKKFIALATFYMFFGAFIAYRQPVFWIVIVLWNSSAYFTQHAVKNCLKEKYHSRYKKAISQEKHISLETQKNLST